MDLLVFVTYSSNGFITYIIMAGYSSIFKLQSDSDYIGFSYTSHWRHHRIGFIPLFS
jgi:hypothetical protein